MEISLLATLLSEIWSFLVVEAGEDKLLEFKRISRKPDICKRSLSLSFWIQDICVLYQKIYKANLHLKCEEIASIYNNVWVNEKMGWSR